MELNIIVITGFGNAMSLETIFNVSRLTAKSGTDGIIH
jgi:hypothetical protein